MSAPGLKSLLLISVLAGCGPKPVPPVLRQLPDAGDLLAHVVDPDGAPVALAFFDGTAAFTDRNGIATGTLAPTAQGWVRLQARGSVTTWVKPLPTPFRGKQIVNATLTPVQLLAPVQPLSEETFTVGDAALRVPMRGFMTPVTISFALLRAQDLGAMAFAPHSAEPELKLQRALSIEASSADAVTQPASPVEVRLRHPARFGAPVLGRFLPEPGQWLMEPGACSRVDAEWIRCTLAHFSTHGVFGPAEPDSTGDAWTDALAGLFDPGHGGTVDALANAAKDFASRHPDEAGKSALMTAAAQATAAGRDDLVTALVDQGRTVVEAMIDAELQEEGCGHLTEMFHLFEQGTLLAVSQARLEALNTRIQNALAGCDVWLGEIHYMYLLQTRMPELEDLVFAEGIRSWTEHHVVMISRDDQGHFHGESTADVKFHQVVYRDGVDDDCGDDFIDMEAGGSPPTGRIRVLFEGVVSEGRWTVTQVSSEPLVNLALRTRYHVHKWSMPDDVCQILLEQDQWLTWTDSYTTQLHRGFLEPSPPSLAQMLTEGDRDTNPLGRGEPVIFGAKRVPVLKQPGVWPFEDMLVAWHFFQVTPPR